MRLLNDAVDGASAPPGADRRGGGASARRRISPPQGASASRSRRSRAREQCETLACEGDGTRCRCHSNLRALVHPRPPPPRRSPPPSSASPIKRRSRHHADLRARLNEKRELTSEDSTSTLEEQLVSVAAAACIERHRHPARHPHGTPGPPRRVRRTASGTPPPASARSSSATSVDSPLSARRRHDFGPPSGNRSRGPLRRDDGDPRDLERPGASSRATAAKNEAGGGEGGPRAPRVSYATSDRRGKRERPGRAPTKLSREAEEERTRAVAGAAS